MKPAAALLWSIAICLTLDGAAFGADPRAAQLTYTPWIKSCIAQTCFVASGARGACHPSGGVISIIVDGKNLSLSAYLATKQPPESAVSIRIDQADPIVIHQSKCVATSCGGKFEIDREFVERLKRSQTIAIKAMDASHTKIGFTLSLAGFAQAFEGAGIEPKAREEFLSPEEMKAMMERAETEKRASECKE
jgi:invasion protein IalB